MVCPTWKQRRLIMNAQERGETSTIKKDGRFYAGMAALVLMVLVMPLSAVVVPLLGLPTAQATTLFAVLAGFPDLFLIVAICLLGTEVSRYFIHVAKNALRAVVDRRFRAGGAMYMIFDKGFLIFSVAERHLDRVHRLVERCTQLMRQAPRKHDLAGFNS
jgi:hypothetical protein